MIIVRKAGEWKNEYSKEDSGFDLAEGGNEMIFGLIINLAVGLLLIILGVLIRSKQKVSLLHDYHYKNVKQEDLPAYTRLMGTGLIVMGTGISITGLFNLFDSPLWWIPLSGGIAGGFIVMNKAQKKYNGSWFS